MTTYTPTTIPVGSFDGSVVDANFDLFQTATCALDGTNFASTSKLEFRHMQPGASTETFIENGNPTTIIFNAFYRYGWWDWATHTREAFFFQR